MLQIANYIPQDEKHPLLDDAHTSHVGPIICVWDVAQIVGNIVAVVSDCERRGCVLPKYIFRVDVMLLRTQSLRGAWGPMGV